MSKKILFIALLFMFIYVSTFNIFLTEIFRVPAPVVFLAPLLMFYRDEEVSFEYSYEWIVFFITLVFYKLIGDSNIASFLAIIINITCLIIFFNYIIAYSRERLILSVNIFFGLLFISGLLMLVDHRYQIDHIRSMLAAETVIQRPSGIATTLFSFGYQMAALTPFLLVSTIMYKRSWLLGVGLFIISICFIFFGMQRSVFVGYSFVAVLFLMFYYRAKSLLFFVGILALFFIGQGSVERFTSENNQLNILNKSLKHANSNEDRGDLITENIKIIAQYPFGLIFYNLTWNEVAQHNFIYKNGHVIITSHNAYLMFITYLGPLLGLLLLTLLYFKISQIIWNAFKQIKLQENIMLVCLSCSFIAVSINSFFHNEWVLSASGPTHILYFSLLQLAKINTYKPVV